MEDSIADHTLIGPLDAAIAKELHDHVNRLLNTLTPREAYILRARLGLDGGEARTLEAIGTALHLSRERVRQLEAQALKKLRYPSGSRWLRGFLEN